MIEHAVQNDFDTVFVKLSYYIPEVLIRAQTAVDKTEVPGIISVRVGFKDRGKIYGIDAEFFHMRYPVDDLQDTVFQYPVVFERCTAKAKGIDLIKDR